MTCKLLYVVSWRLSASRKWQRLLCSCHPYSLFGLFKRGRPFCFWWREDKTLLFISTENFQCTRPARLFLSLYERVCMRIESHVLCFGSVLCWLLVWEEEEVSSRVGCRSGRRHRGLAGALSPLESVRLGNGREEEPHESSSDIVAIQCYYNYGITLRLI